MSQPRTNRRTSDNVGAEAETESVVVTNAGETAEVDAPKYSQEELLAIFDALTFEYEYREKITLRRLEVELRTRTSSEVDEIVTAVDRSGFNTYAGVEYARSIENLKASLCRYGTKDLSIMTAAEKTAFIGKLPSPIIHALIDKLVEFDAKVSAAIAEGEANF